VGGRLVCRWLAARQALLFFEIVLLFCGDVGRRRALQHCLAAVQHLEQTGLIDIEVGVQPCGRFSREHELSLLEFPEQVKGVTGSADPTTAGMSQSPALKCVDPGATWLRQLENAGLPGVDDLIEQAKQIGPVNRLEGRGLSFGPIAGPPFAPAEELHGAPSLYSRIFSGQPKNA
jgi:hypothetical protein